MRPYRVPAALWANAQGRIAGLPGPWQSEKHQAEAFESSDRPPRHSQKSLAKSNRPITIRVVYQVETTAEFDDWLQSLPDALTRVRLGRRLDKATRGNLGDVKPIGEGVWEMREFFGPGWRMYYLRRGEVLILMLGGGDKATQPRDIAQARDLARLFKE